MDQFTPIEVDRVEILTVVDNYSNALLPNGPHVERFKRGTGDKVSNSTLLAEHGLCLLIKAQVGQDTHTVLMDSGYTSVAAPHNMELLEVGLNNLDAVVLSHGHMDHTGGLLALLDKIKQPVDIYAHPVAFLTDRYMINPDGGRRQVPVQAGPDQIAAAGARLHQHTGPEMIAGGTMVVSGQVEKVTDFETGSPNAVIKRGEDFEQDPISDDQFVVLRVKGLGLVVVTGCAHSGVINTVRYAQKITGVDQVHTVAGGFHLSGPLFEPLIDETLEHLKALDPKVVVPMHCSGFNAQNRFAQEFGEGFILNSVGSTIKVGAAA